MEPSYEFDPCTVDGSNEEETLDNWKPTPKINNFRNPSKWRSEQNSKRVDDCPGIDEINKILAHIKNNVPDYEVMKLFSIRAETYIAIAKGRYHPVEGLKLSEIDIMCEKITALGKRTDKLKDALKTQVNTLKNNQEFNAWIDKKLSNETARAVQGVNTNV